MPAFARALAPRGFRARHFKDPWLFLLAGKIDGPVIVVPVYNEARSLRMPRFIESVARKRYGTAAVLHPTHIAAIISDKVATNHALSEAGVPMPALVEGRAGTLVFSNARDQSGARVNVVEAGEVPDPSRYNAELIDTVHELNGSQYFVCLRVACVGRIPCSITVRARPAEDKNPSVHLGNTPRDPELLNWLYETLVRDRRGEIEEMCSRVERRLGVGFYGHDIMPESGTGKLYLAETGFKFDDLGYSGRMHSIAGSLTFADEFSNAAIERAADALLSEARRTGALPGGHA